MIEYSAANARMHGLKGWLLTAEDYDALLQASDVQACLSILSRSAYSENIQDLTDLAKVEHALKQDFALSCMKIASFLTGKNSSDFFKTLISRFDLINLKSVIRAIINKSDPKIVSEPMIISIGKYHIIPIEKILEVSTLESLLSSIHGTQFAHALGLGYQQYEMEQKSFLLELVLDFDYYRKLLLALGKLNTVDKHNTGELLGIQCDVLNLLWIMRFKEHYGFSPEQISQYIIPHARRVRASSALKIAGESDVIGTIIGLKISPYDEIVKSATKINESMILGVELALLRYLRYMCSTAFVKYPLQAAPLMAFFILKEMEIKDIITILNGKQLGLSQERIKSHLITL
jgi:V/A-type H+/Na+-transporting ATPase subunit C